jgi:hypothetical protein
LTWNFILGPNWFTSNQTKNSSIWMLGANHTNACFKLIFVCWSREWEQNPVNSTRFTTKH